MSTTPKGRKNANLHIEQKDVEFVQLLWNLFNAIGIVGAKPHTRCRMDKRTNNTYTSTQFATFTHSFFTEMFQLWYLNVDGKNIKIVPANLADLFTSVSLAYWVSSDVTFRKDSGTVVLCTDSFSADEVDFLRSLLLEKFNIQSTRVSNGMSKNQYRISIAKASVPTIQNIVYPHMPSTMTFRVGL